MRLGSLLRVKNFVVANWGILSITLLVLSVACLGVSVVSHDSLPMKTVEEKKHPVTAEMDVGTETVVTGNTSFYQRGTKLSDMPVYLRSFSSNLTLSLRTQVPENTSVRQSLSLVHRVGHSDDVFWEDSRLVASDGTVVDNGETTVSGVVNIAEVQQKHQEIRSEMEGSGTVETFVVANTTYDTERYQGEMTEEAKLRIDGSSYALNGNLSRREKHTMSVESRTVDEDAVVTLPLPFDGAEKTLAKETGLFAGVGFLSLLIGFLVAVYGEFGPSRERLRRRLDKERYSEWISVGEIPFGANERKVRMSSLEDLVDVGIDTSKRTIHDKEEGRYGVIDDGVLYYYEDSKEFVSSDGERNGESPEGVENGKDADESLSIQKQ